MIDFNRHIEIEQYIQGNLSNEEKAAFEAKMTSDNHLREEVELQQLANSLVVGNAKLEIKNQLKNIHSNSIKEQRNQRNLKWLIGLLTILVAGAVILFSLDSQVKKEENRPNSLFIPDNLNKSEEINSEINTTKTPENEVLSDKNLIADPIKKETTKEPFKKPTLIINSPVPLTGNREESVPPDTSISGFGVGPTDIARIDTFINNPDTIFVVEDPARDCGEIEKTKPICEVMQPCFGKKKGSLKFDDSRFESFKLSNSIELYGSFDEVALPVGQYSFVGINENNCKSARINVEVKYQDCNYAISPDKMQFLEFSFTDEEIPIIFTLRDARSGFEVYKQSIDFAGDFTYTGLGSNGIPLPMANYVYLVTKASGEFITKGQITIIR